MDPEDMPAITKTLREHALAARSVRVPPDTMLDAEHQAVLVRAIRNVLAAEEAVFTFSQIVDGLPTGDVAWDRRTHHLTGDHPLDEHEELCLGAMDKARELYSEPSAAPGSPAFATRLVVFDRRAEEADVARPASVYLHPNRKRVTRQVTQLRDEQQRALVDYLLVEDPTTSDCPIPILVDRDNRERVDPEVSIIKHSIFRDIWERKPLTIADMDVAVRRPRQQVDHPEIFDTMLYSNLVLGNRLSESGESPVYNPVIKERVIQELRKMETEKEVKRETEAPHEQAAKEENETVSSGDDDGRKSGPEETPKKRESHVGQDDGDGHSKAGDEERRKRRREE